MMPTLNPVWLLAFWAGLFLVTHFALSSRAVRPRLVKALGEQSYRGIYSALSLGTFIPLVWVFAYHKHAGPALWYLRDAAPVRWLVWIIMLFSLIVIVAGLSNPAPSGMGAENAGPATPRGILKLTRHPMFIGISLFGIAHMLVNGWVGDLIFFGSFPALGILGALHQDQRKMLDLGDSYRRMVAQTSLVPGIALIDGRQRWTREDTPWRAILIGAALTVLLVILHPMIFGGHPLG